jgi:hypothetical protein
MPRPKYCNLSGPVQGFPLSDVIPRSTSFSSRCFARLACLRERHSFRRASICAVSLDPQIPFPATCCLEEFGIAEFPDPLFFS